MEHQKPAGKLDKLKQRLSMEEQRHREAVTAIEEEMRQRAAGIEPELPVALRKARKKTVPLHWQIANTLGNAINAEYAEQDLGTLLQKQSVIETIRDELRAHGMKVLCPHCNKAADLYVSGSQESIRYRHTVEGHRKLSHGGRRRLSRLTLVPISALNSVGEIVLPNPKQE